MTRADEILEAWEWVNEHALYVEATVVTESDPTDTVALGYCVKILNAAWKNHLAIFLHVMGDDYDRFAKLHPHDPPRVLAMRLLVEYTRDTIMVMASKHKVTLPVTFLLNVTADDPDGELKRMNLNSEAREPRSMN